MRFDSKNQWRQHCRFAAGMLLVLLVGPASAQYISSAQTDKARYAPGESVAFSVTLDSPQSGQVLAVKYYQAGTLVSQQTVPVTTAAASWSWTPPTTDYQGYLVALTLQSGTTVYDQTGIGVDVSSSWVKFPRYGFLSAYGQLSSSAMDATMRQLTRYHLNGLQFYDWMDQHHKPLAGTAAAPAAQWNDLANRPTYYATIKGYVDRAHASGMKALFYNLLYGAYPSAGTDGVDLANWGLYTDVSHASGYAITGLPSSWETTTLNLLDPNNAAWRTYLLAQHGNVYDAGFGFDGWHVDQIGDPGTVYTYAGQAVSLPQGFASMLTGAKTARPTKSLVMNAVDNFGQSQIAPAPIDFVYTEMWTNNEGYANIASTLQANEAASGGKRNVMAAYVNRASSTTTGYFNDASVLMADAVMFAFGGSHIELGEHLLGNEYFPNSNLQMSARLQASLTTYYDFLTGYENLLRGDGRTFNTVALTGTNVQAWPPVLGKIASVGTTVGSRQVFHLLNFTQAQTLNWRDNGQVQPEPTTRTSLSLSFPLTATVNRLWIASPDVNGGLPQDVTFTQTGGTVSFTLPTLKYWTMVVAETGTVTAIKATGAGVAFALQSFPNPFRGSATVRFTLPTREAAELAVYDLQGRLVLQLPQGMLSAGEHEATLADQSLAPGVYLCRLQAASGSAVQRLVKLD
ncbi:MAG: glycoside hydrolase family 66 protein [Janthinobacterium lividum]